MYRLWFVPKPTLPSLIMMTKVLLGSETATNLTKLLKIARDFDRQSCPTKALLFAKFKLRAFFDSSKGKVIKVCHTIQ